MNRIKCDKRLGDRLLVATIGDAQERPLRTGRVRERAQEVEDRPHTKRLANGNHVLVGRVMDRCMHVTEADRSDARADGLRAEPDLYPQRLEHVGGARFRGCGAVPVLGHPAASPRGDQSRGSGDVERRGPAAGAGCVEKITVAHINALDEFAHGSGKADQLRDRLTLCAQPDEEGRSLDLACIPSHDLGEHGGSMIGGQILAVRDSVDGSRQNWVRHLVISRPYCERFTGQFFMEPALPLPSPVPGLRKLRRSSFPSGVSTDSGWN